MRSPGELPLLLTLTPSTLADAERLRDGLRQPEGEVKNARQVSGKGVYAHVKLRVRFRGDHEGRR